jgi:hypothetical protein
MTEIKSITLHNVVFCGGKNHSTKIMANKDILRLGFLEDKSWYFIVYNKQCKFIPSTNVSDFEVIDPGEYGVKIDMTKPTPMSTPVYKDAKPTISNIMDAQVETPHGGKVKR